VGQIFYLYGKETIISDFDYYRAPKNPTKSRNRRPQRQHHYDAEMPCLFTGKTELHKNAHTIPAALLGKYEKKAKRPSMVHKDVNEIQNACFEKNALNTSFLATIKNILQIYDLDNSNDKCGIAELKKDLMSTFGTEIHTLERGFILRDTALFTLLVLLQLIDTESKQDSQKLRGNNRIIIEDAWENFKKSRNDLHIKTAIHWYHTNTEGPFNHHTFSINLEQQETVIRWKILGIYLIEIRINEKYLKDFHGLEIVENILPSKKGIHWTAVSGHRLPETQLVAELLLATSNGYEHYKKDGKVKSTEAVRKHFRKMLTNLYNPTDKQDRVLTKAIKRKYRGNKSIKKVLHSIFKSGPTQEIRRNASWNDINL
jgi:hypothetical protein